MGQPRREYMAQDDEHAGDSGESSRGGLSALGRLPWRRSFARDSGSDESGMETPVPGWTFTEKPNAPARDLTLTPRPDALSHYIMLKEEPTTSPNGRREMAVRGSIFTNATLEPS